jgi:hypothetical protein
MNTQLEHFEIAKENLRAAQIATPRTVFAVVFDDPHPPLQSIAESLYRYTPHIVIRPPQTLLLDVKSCLRLYSVESFQLRLQVMLSRFQMSARMARSSTPGHALAMALHGVHSEAQLPIEALSFFGSPFKTQPELENKLLQVAQRCRKLGLRLLSDLFQQPLQELTQRFDHDFLVAYENALKVRTSLWPHFQPTQILSESVDFLSSAGLAVSDRETNIEGLLFLIKGLLDRLSARLYSRSERISRMRISFYQEAFSTVKQLRRDHVFDLPLAPSTARGLLQIIQEKLQRDLSHNPFESCVEKIEITVLETSPSPLRQRDLMDNHNEVLEKWNSLMSRLWQRLAKENVFFMKPKESFKPEESWQRILPERKELGADAGQRDLFSAIPTRPTRLLPTPLPLIEHHSTLLNPQSGLRWEVDRWEESEIVAGQWWKSQFSREYFQVKTIEGQRLWVFRDLSKPNQKHLYLHGFFD